MSNAKDDGVNGLPEWTSKLDPRDLVRLINRSLKAKDGEERAKVWEEAEEYATDVYYQTARRVMAGERLTEKTICMPEIRCADPKPLEGIGAMAVPDGKTHGDLYRDIQRMRIEEWIETVRAFEAKPNDFFNAWWYLMRHPAFYEFGGDDGMTSPEDRIHERNLNSIRDAWHLPQSVDVMVTQVNPDTGEIDDDEKLNTCTQVWVELGKRSWPGTGAWPLWKDEEYSRDSNTHDWRLDCGGDSFEEAIITAAVYVHTEYGNDRRICDKEDEGDE